jgi:C_GCAxxG_C_C family probable redox protein
MAMQIEDRVQEMFGQGQLFCAETVVKLIAEAGGKDSGDAVRMATGFCSGVSRTCGQCGALSGAIMGLGLYVGRSEPGAEYDACYALVQEFVSRFEEKFSSINCYGLIECDFATPEGVERFKEKQLITQCVQYAVFAVEIVLELLRDNGYLEEE